MLEIKDWEFVRGELGGIWETVRSGKLSASLPVWEKISLPHCYNARDAVDPDTPYYQGPAWYRTQLSVANPFKNGRTLLRFEGAGQDTEVFIGAKKAGSHSGGYNAFTIDITDAVRDYEKTPHFATKSPDRIIEPGLIPLAVRCDNSRNLETVPSDLSDFNLYGGLYRTVSLVYNPAVFINQISVKPERAGNDWTVRVEGNVCNPAGLSDKIHAVVRIFAPDKKMVAEHKSVFRATAPVISLCGIKIASPRLWAPDKPALYRCEVALESAYGRQVISEKFGLRWFEFAENGPFYLNGKRLLLRGTHRHEDHAGLGAAMPDTLIAREMRLIKQMGVNFIRLGHYPQSETVLNLCDELGILVWEEIPWCRGGLGGKNYRAQAETMLRSMINAHRNHPSVIIWGLGNENDWPGDFEKFNKQAIRNFMRKLHNISHELDPERKTAIRRCAFCSDIVDVYSPSIWAGWYRGKYIEYRDVTEKEIDKVKHFLHVEWGGDSHAGRHSENPYARLMNIETTGQADERGLDFMMTGGTVRASKDGDWSETYICDLVDWHLKEQETFDRLTGTAFWVFKDFSTPLRPDNPVPFVNQKGAVERDLTPKESYYVYQSYWTKKPMARIYAHSLPARWGKANEEKTVKVYSNCPKVELFLNNTSLGEKTRDVHDFPAAGLRWKTVFRPGMNHLKAVARKGKVEITDEITFRYETREWKKPARLAFRIAGRKGDRVTVNAELLDENGVLCLDAENFVRFSLAGEGTLLDNLGTAGGSRKVGLRNGRACIDVQLNKGRSVAGVSCEECVPAFIELAPLRSGPARNSGFDRQFKKEIVEFEKARVTKMADACFDTPPLSIRDFPAPANYVKPGDFYSSGDYWWPNPNTPDGLPYVQRDGQSNPANFSEHRKTLMRLRDTVAALAAAFAIHGDEKYAERAVRMLAVFFLDKETRMNPHLLYAQAIPGICRGRGIGIIDTLHLAEVAPAISAMQGAKAMKPVILTGLKKWFSDYSGWIMTHPYGIEEINTGNNHSVACLLQLAAFARLTGDTAKLQMIQERFTQTTIPAQMDMDGSFPRELMRTKPYGYSLFQLDNICLLCELLSAKEENLWNLELPDKRCMRKAVEFMLPYIKDKATWPYRADIEHFGQWPVRHFSLLLAALRLGRADCLALWKTLDPDPADPEIRRNTAVTQPVLWLL